MTRPGIRNDDSRSSVLRAFGLLDVFTPTDSELSLADLSRRSGNPKTSTHRMVQDLLTVGALERGRTGYRLGVKLFELGHLVPQQRRLREAALPFLQDLHEITRLTANLAVRDRLDIVYIEKLVSREINVPHTRTGGRLPLYCTALGKAILAFSGADLIDRVLAQHRPALTSRTIVGDAEMRRELVEIRTQRVAFDNEESQQGLFCVASPVFVGLRAVAALSVTGATAAEQTQRLAPTVIMVARTLSRFLGGGPLIG